MVIIQQGGGLRRHPKDDVATIATIATVGPAEWLELFALDRDTAVAAGSAGYVQDYPVYKARHVNLLLLLPALLHKSERHRRPNRL